jgi:UDP-N-acetylmuramate--alanine ligase
LAEVSLPGRHNILNALAAVGVGLELGLDFSAIQRGLQRFTGVRRRFQVKGEAAGIMVVDDYAHHPTEVEATLQAARDALKGKAGRLVVAFQPHLYSRTQLLYRDFARVLGSADEIYLAGIYPARETPIPGVSSQLISDLLQQAGKAVHYHFDPAEMKGKLLEALRPGDLFMTIGAGSLDKLGEEVLSELKARA